MFKGPKISVVIPVYNVADYLSRCLESLRCQSLLDIEIICVNDGSTDNSAEIIEKQMKADGRILLINKKNAGVAAARNTGIDAATGDMIMFLDPDDYLAENACERVYEERINHYADIIVYGSTPFPEIPKPDPWVVWNLESRDKYYDKPSEKALFKEQNATPFIWNHAFSRDFLNDNKIRFIEGVKFGEDLVFLFQTVPMAQRVQYISDELHYYQSYRSGSFMQKYNAENEIRLQQHVKNLETITEYWDRKKILDKWGKSYFDWFIDFIVPDLIYIEPKNKQNLAREVIKIIEKYHLKRFYARTKLETKTRIKRLYKIGKGK